MTIKEIYNLAIKMGIKADPRPLIKINKLLEKNKKLFNNLKKIEQVGFDQEKLTNPYADARILFGNPLKIIKKVLVGIDISVSELLLADRLIEKGEKIDLVISHHPSGNALAKLNDVVGMQADFLSELGIPINITENLIEPISEEVERSLSPGNYNRSVDTAKILNIPFLCIHTPTDNLAYRFLQNKIDQENPDTLGELIDLIKKIPEYSIVNKIDMGPKISIGKPDRHCGKIAVTEFTGGTSGSKLIYEKLSQIGIGTIVSMHMNEEHRQEAIKHHLNVIIAGHIASDSLGMNLFLDELEKNNIRIIPCSGLIRINRIK